MRVGMVADLVARGGDCSRNLRQAPHIRAALEESRRRAVAIQDLQQLRRRFAGAVVEGQRDRPAGRELRDTPRAPSIDDERPRTA